MKIKRGDYIKVVNYGNCNDVDAEFNGIVGIVELITEPIAFKFIIKILINKESGFSQTFESLHLYEHEVELIEENQVKKLMVFKC